MTCRLTARALAACLLLLASAAPSPSQSVVTGTQDYFIVGHEEHVWNLFNRVAVGEGNPIFAAGMESVVSMTSSANDQVIYYDHWEDGYEADIRNPTQGTTLVFGDNNPANGDVRDYSSDPRLTSDQILLGTNIELTSEASAGPPLEQFVPMPRNSADLRFDGGDFVHSTGGPLSGLLFTGGPGSYQTRFYALLPDRMHGKDFLSITPGDVGANRPQNLYIFNPNDFNIDVTATDSLGSNTFTIAPGASVAYSEPTVMNRLVPGNSTARLLSSHNFWGLTAREYNGTGTDWGHSWIVTRFLSDYYSIAWSPGTRDPAGAYANRGTRGCNGITPCNSENRSPVFVSAREDNTRVQIGLDWDGNADQVDLNSDDVPDVAPLPGNI